MPRPPTRAPDDLEAYVAAVEGALTRLRGRVVELTGRDFALARGWHAAGVPVETVVATLEEHFAAGRGGQSLTYLRRQVEARAGRSRATPAGGAATATAPARAAGSRDDVDAARDWLARLHAWLDTRAGDPATRWAAIRGHERALTRRLEAPRFPTAAELEAALGTLDEALSEAALRACGVAAAARFRAEAARAVARQRGRLDEAALEAALRRYVRRRARETWAVPERG